jgi:hypothetical protein
MFKTLGLFMVSMLCFALGYADEQINQSSLQDLSLRSRCHHRRHHNSPEIFCPQREADQGPRGHSVRAYANLFLNSSLVVTVPSIANSGTGILLPGRGPVLNLEYDSETGEVIILHKGDYLIEVAASLANIELLDLQPVGQPENFPSFTLGIVKGDLRKDPTNYTVVGSYGIINSPTSRPSDEQAFTLMGKLILSLHPGDRIAFANVDITPTPHNAFLYPSPTAFGSEGGTVATLTIRLLNGVGS